MILKAVMGEAEMGQAEAQHCLPMVLKEPGDLCLPMPLLGRVLYRQCFYRLNLSGIFFRAGLKTPLRSLDRL